MSTRARLFGPMLALALAACGPTYERTELSGVVLPSTPGGSITETSVVVPVGAVLKAHIVSLNSDDENVSGPVRSDNPSIMEVSALTTSDDWAFIGRRVGRTRVVVLVDGSAVMVLDALVTEQAP